MTVLKKTLGHCIIIELHEHSTHYWLPLKVLYRACYSFTTTFKILVLNSCSWLANFIQVFCIVYTVYTISQFGQDGLDLDRPRKTLGKTE